MTLKTVAVLSLCASASAFAPLPIRARTSIAVSMADDVEGPGKINGLIDLDSPKVVNNEVCYKFRRNECAWSERFYFYLLDHLFISCLLYSRMQDRSFFISCVSDMNIPRTSRPNYVCTFTHARGQLIHNVP